MSNFTRSKNNLELKLLLLNTLEDFNEDLAMILNRAIMDLTDRDIVEMIIDIRNNEDDKKIIRTVLQKLVKKEPQIEELIKKEIGTHFWEQYLNK